MGFTPLVLACGVANADMVRILVDAGADDPCAGGDRPRPLSELIMSSTYATEEDQVATVSVLLGDNTARRQVVDLEQPLHVYREVAQGTVLGLAAADELLLLSRQLIGGGSVITDTTVQTMTNSSHAAGLSLCVEHGAAAELSWISPEDRDLAAFAGYLADACVIYRGDDRLASLDGGHGDGGGDEGARAEWRETNRPALFEAIKAGSMRLATAAIAELGGDGEPDWPTMGSGALSAVRVALTGPNAAVAFAVLVSACRYSFRAAAGLASCYATFAENSGEYGDARLRDRASELAAMCRSAAAAMAPCLWGVGLPLARGTADECPIPIELVLKLAAWAAAGSALGGDGCEDDGCGGDGCGDDVALLAETVCWQAAVAAMDRIADQAVETGESAEATIVAAAKRSATCLCLAYIDRLGPF